MTALAKRMKSALERSGLSQADLARQCGVSAASVSDWFSGKTRTLKGESLLKAAAALKVNAAWLGRGEGPTFHVAEHSPIYGMPQAQSAVVAREGRTCEWAFLHISPERWQRLPISERMRVETFAEATLQAWEARHPPKSSGEAREPWTTTV